MYVTAIIAAGGRGRRLGDAQPKQLLQIGGRPILERSVAAFLGHPAIDALIVALPLELADAPPVYLQSATKPLRVVAGGARRQDSVAHAFHAVAGQTDIVVIHDGARPFASADLISRTIDAAAESGAALAALPSRDTVKRGAWRPASAGRGAIGRAAADSQSSPGWVVDETLPRESIFLAQTPQAFRRDVLRDALALAAEGAEATDEAALAERAGHTVRLVEGEATNIKITAPEDLPIAEAIAGARERRDDRSVERSAHAFAPQLQRVGTGYDLHRLVEGRRLVIGGVAIASDRGALGHSDADVVCHAVTDAILGAACLGDIGRHFPDADPRWKGASSLDLLARAAVLVAGAGYEVGNVDVSVILEMPKIRDQIGAMREAIARALGVEAGRVSIKGKTNEGLDAIGRGEAIAAHAVAIIRAIRHQPEPSAT